MAQSERTIAIRIRTMWLLLLLFATAQIAQIVALVLWRQPSKGRELEQATDTMRIRSLRIVTPDNEEIACLEAIPFEFRVGEGPRQHSFSSRLQLRHPGASRPLIDLEVTPLDGPTVHLRHHRSNSYMGVSCVNDDAFSIHFSPSGEHGSFRIVSHTQTKQLRVLDSIDRPFIIIDASTDGNLQPRITLVSDLIQPIQIQKHQRK